MPTTSRSGWGVAVALAGLLVLTGCGGGTASAPAPSEPSAAPSASADPAPAPAVIAFGGDCANVIDPAPYAGADASAHHADPPSPILTLGGISCSWYGSSGSTLSIDVFPEHLVTGDLASKYGDPTCENAYDGLDCHVAGTANGTWVHVAMPALIESGAAPEGLQAALDDVLSRTGDWPAPVAETRTGLWWDPVDCEQLGALIDVAGIMQGTEFYAGYPTGFGPSVSREILEREGVTAWCPWYSYELGGIWMRLYPGSGFQWAEVAGTPATVAGAVEAVTIEGPGASTLYATDGTNTVSVSEAPIPREELAARVLAALNG